MIVPEILYMTDMKTYEWTRPRIKEVLLNLDNGITKEDIKEGYCLGGGIYRVHLEVDGKMFFVVVYAKDDNNELYKAIMSGKGLDNNIIQDLVNMILIHFQEDIWSIRNTRGEFTQFIYTRFGKKLNKMYDDFFGDITLEYIGDCVVRLDEEDNKKLIWES